MGSLILHDLQVFCFNMSSYISVKREKILIPVVLSCIEGDPVLF